MEENNEVIENNNEETKEVLSVVQGFGQMTKKTDTKCEIFTNIEDKKKIFNLENHVDNLLNDFENSIIEVKEVLIKKYTKKLKEPVLDEQTGEVLKDTETSMACILIDKNNVSYATGSKIFTIQMMRFLDMFGITNEGFMIKIVKNKQQDSGNKSLGFELV